MLNIDKYAEGKTLFDGRYKLLRPLSTEGGTADVWLAEDVNTRDNPELMGELQDARNGSDSGMLVAIKIYGSSDSVTNTR